MSDVLSTSVSSTAMPVTLQDVKRHLYVTSTEDDSLITSYIKSATLMLENKTNRAFIAQTRVLKADSFDDCRYVRDRRLYPQRSPLRSVSSLAYITSTGGSSTVPSSDYVVSTGDQPGYVAEAYSATWPAPQLRPNAVTLTYVAGHSTVPTGIPENVKQAIRMVVGHWYRNREATIVGTISSEIQIGVDALLESEMVERYA